MGRRETVNTSMQDSIFQWGTVIDAITDYIFLLDADFNIVKTNKSMRGFLGKTDEEMIGKHCWELTHGTTEPPDFCPLTKMMESKKRESTVIELNGRYMKITVDPILDKGGSMEGVVHIIRDIDESERKNITIRENEKKYHELVDTMSDVVFTLDFDGVIIDTSPTIKRIIGLSKEESIGKHFSDFVHPDDLPRAEEEFLRAIQAKGHPIEIRVFQVDGALRWIRINALLIMKDGEPENLLCVLTDIHEKKLVEGTLTKSQALLHEAERMAKIGGWEFDAKTQNQTWTEETFRILEIDTAGGEPRVPEGIQFITPEYRPMAEKAMQRAIEHGEPYDQEWEVITKKGNRRWVRSIAKANRENGIITRISGSLQDITESKLVQEKLQESDRKVRESNAILLEERDKAQHYLNDVGAIIVNLNRSGNVVLINRRGCELLGMSESDIIGKNWFENFLPEDIRTDVKRVFDELMAGRIENLENYDNQLLASDGRIRMISWHNALLKDESGGIIGTLSAGEDVSERLQMEMNLRIATENVSRINMNLIDAKLRSQTYFDFLAHDIANIMSPIMAYAELMSKGDQYPPEVVLFTEKIVDQAQKATSLIHNLRKLEMLEEKNLPDMNIVDIKRIFSFVENSIRHKYPEKKPTFTYHLPEDLPIKSRGGEYIDFVIRHIFDNAVRHAQKAIVNIDVRIDKEGENVGGKFWRILIEDDGPGISDRVKKEITTPLDPAKRYSRGVASSLAFCSAAVVGIGGELYIEDRVPNDPSKGTRVIVWVPVYD